MSTPILNAALRRDPRLALPWRLGIVGGVLAVETLFFSYVIQQTPLDALTGAARALRETQHWLFRFMIVYAVVLGMLAYLRGAATRTSPMRPSPIAPNAELPVRHWFTLLHVALLAPFLVLSAALYSGRFAAPFVLLALAWHACAAAAALALLAAAAPLPAWVRAVRHTGALPLYALAAAAAAVAGIQASQHFWQPTAELTFRLVLATLRPMLPTLAGNHATLTLATDRFAVTISDKCSGLEGVGLMLVFCVTWLSLDRHEYRFPRALAIIPAAMLLMFMLNALRIAALVLIGDAGYPGIATVGFHSQAGWIAFNLVALGTAVASKHSAWLHKPRARAAITGSRIDGTDPAAYLVPLLTILAAGMVSHALSAGFEWLYPLRFVAAAAVLWAYRRRYAALDWHCTWRGVAVGLCIAVLWCAFASILLPHASRPDALTALPAPLRTGWLAARLLAATVTVPIAEELAYRGYLLRRVESADFAAVPWNSVRWSSLALVSAAFGLTHGTLWLPAIVAGAAYGALAIKTGKIGEAVVAHATTNATLAVVVLLFDQWQLW